MDAYDLIVVGSGSAGEKAAALAAHFGKRVAVVERDERPGGVPVDRGPDPHQSASTNGTGDEFSWATGSETRTEGGKQ